MRAIVSQTKKIKPSPGKLTDSYLRGEYLGVIGGKPEQKHWADPDYKAGYLAGLSDFFDGRFA